MLIFVCPPELCMKLRTLVVSSLGIIVKDKFSENVGALDSAKERRPERPRFPPAAIAVLIEAKTS
ncbi:MAG: hypothetical protein BWX44_01310 [Spirochaetes bacterium ADurb.Bin001]|nr:MAG: hypothetical protein BWX44_01310 [Spirochaetes bacterium ADurb.Bin001]